MGFDLIPFASALIQKQAVGEVVKCNDYTAQFGLVLTQTQAVELVETRSLSLRENGRIEFGGGVIDKIIREFCDSPYISMQNYAETLHELIETFYFYKNDTLDLLSSRELYHLARNLRFGFPADYSDDNFSENEGEYDE